MPADGIAELLDWLRIPSVSGDAQRAGDVRAAGEWLARWLRAAGASVRIVASAGGPPVVVGRFAGSATGRRPAVLYGHYDVQPPGPGWKAAPFCPRVERGRIIARGASDDKGQFLVHLTALRALSRSGTLPRDVLVLADGAEEIGSPGLRAALERLATGRASAVVISDTQRGPSGAPAVTVSQRGLLRMHACVDVGGRPVHPGRFAGAVVDPCVLLCDAIQRVSRALAALPGVQPPEPHRPLVWVHDASLRAAAGGRAVVAGGGLHCRVSTRAALTVSQLSAGGPSAASPTQARAVLDVRLPPGVAPERAAPLLCRLLSADRVRVRVAAAARGNDALPPRAVLDAVDRATTASFGTPPDYVRSGGSVPAVHELARAFGVIPVLWGFGPVDDGAHGPEEYFDVVTWQRAGAASRNFWRWFDTDWRDMSKAPAR